MIKKLFFISSLLILTNCTAPGTVLLGPAFTGAKTGSIYQASLSFGTGRIMSEISDININSFFEKQIKEFNNNFKVEAFPRILDTYALKEIEVSEVIEPEPLP